MQITFVTGNPNKAQQVARYLDYPLTHRALDVPEPQSLDLKEIVTMKAKAAYEQVNTPVLVEDVSLTFPALGKLPGPLIKWFLQELGNEGLCRLLDGKDRTAIASVYFAYYDGTEMQYFIGQTKGTLTEHPRGNDFGWNPIFIPDGSTKTWGEMNEAESIATAMRKPALEKLKAFLENA
jgi:non-canonical purine NTP pyrophosphatase (RdgB/HAM1 family)